jgi:catechol 2,3-dioxygenase-like lactoylglutathione lyase family enzyme
VSVHLVTVDHVGFVVDDLDRAQRFLVDALGFHVEREFSIPGRVQGALLRHGALGVEIMDVSASPSESAPETHLALEVERLDDAVAALRARGVETTRAEASHLGSVRSFFTRPASTGGVMYQLFERVDPAATVEHA